MTNVIQLQQQETYDDVEFKVDTAEELELIETAEEVSDAINYFVKQLKLSETDSDERSNAIRELRIIKEFYRMKEFTSYFDDNFPS